MSLSRRAFRWPDRGLCHRLWRRDTRRHPAGIRWWRCWARLLAARAARSDHRPSLPNDASPVSLFQAAEGRGLLVNSSFSSAALTFLTGVIAAGAGSALAAVAPAVVAPVLGAAFCHRQTRCQTGSADPDRAPAWDQTSGRRPPGETVGCPLDGVVDQLLTRLNPAGSLLVVLVPGIKLWLPVSSLNQT